MKGGLDCYASLCGQACKDVDSIRGGTIQELQPSLRFARFPAGRSPGQDAGMAYCAAGEAGIHAGEKPVHVHDCRLTGIQHAQVEKGMLA